MQFQRYGDSFQLRLESGDGVKESLTRLLREEQIGYAAITGLGSLKRASLSYWNAGTREYESHRFEEQLEVVGLIGNAALRDGGPVLHLHITLGRRDLSLMGGHFRDGVAHPTLEVWLQSQRQPVQRATDQASRLPLMQLPEALPD